jgi:hypothetical protein
MTGEQLTRSVNFLDVMQMPGVAIFSTALKTFRSPSRAAQLLPARDGRQRAADPRAER